MKELLQEIKKHNVLLEVVDGRLKLFCEHHQLDAGLIERIKEHKQEIIRLLSVSSNKARGSHIAAIPVQSDYPLSSSQRRLWVICQLDDANSAYNIPGAFELDGLVDLQALESSFRALIDRHESLRTIFRENEHGEVRQIILHPNGNEFEINYRDLRFESNPEEEVNNVLQNDFIAPFDLRQGPLLRAGLYRVDDERWLFSCVMHHIVSDGWSMSVLIRDILSYYNSIMRGTPVSLPQLRIQYKDYAAWQQCQLSDAHVIDHKNYWIKQFSGDLPQLNLRTERQRPSVRTYNGSAVQLQLDASMTTTLKLVAVGHEGTLFILLLCAVTIVLKQNSGQDDLILGTPVAGREEVELEDLIGLFLNTLALRLNIGRAQNFTDIFQIAKEVSVGAFEHQAFPFDELVETLSLKRIANRNFLFDVWIVLHSNEINSMKEIVLDGLVVRTRAKQSESQSKFDLMFSFAEQNDELVAILEYNTDIVSKREAEQISKQLITTLQMIADNPVVPLDCIYHQLDLIAHNSRQEQAAKRRSKNLLNLKKY